MVRPGQGMGGKGFDVMGACARRLRGQLGVGSAVCRAMARHSSSAKAMRGRAEGAMAAGACAGAATGSTCADAQASRS